MAISFKYKLYAGFAATILLSATGGVTSYLIFQKQARQRFWVRRAHHAIDSANYIKTLVLDMETGRRGFRATNQKRFLEPYTVALTRIESSIAGLKDSLADDPVEQTKVAILESHIHDLMRFWAHNGDDAEKYTREYITILTDEEKRRMDEIRQFIAEIVQDENILLTQRRQEYEALIHDGTLSATVGSLLSEATIIVLIFFVFREFKCRRKIREQLNGSVKILEQQANELQASGSELQRALTEVETINKQLEKFVYTVAHDIKSPLAGINGSLSILEMDPAIIASPELAEFVHLSVDRVVHLSDMVNSILEYSRVSLDKQQVEEVDTKKLVIEIATLMFPPQHIHISVAQEMPVFKTKRIKIMEVFQNLISNAIKYNNKKEGYIEIGYKEMEGYYRFYVKDNGFGIADENKPHIFSLFRDTNNKPTRESSTGFGLNIAKLIVEEQGGKIWVDSTPGEGSTFYFDWKK